MRQPGDPVEDAGEGFVSVGDVLTRNAARAGALAAATALMTALMTVPGFALSQPSGSDPGKGLSVAQTLGLYVGIPVLSFAVIAGLVMLLDKSKIRHYRPKSTKS